MSSNAFSLLLDPLHDLNGNAQISQKARAILTILVLSSKQQSKTATGCQEAVEEEALTSEQANTVKWSHFVCKFHKPLDQFKGPAGK